MSLKRAHPAEELWMQPRWKLTDSTAVFSQCESPHSQLHAGSTPGREKKILKQMIRYTARGTFSVGKLCSFWALLWTKRQANNVWKSTLTESPLMDRWWRNRSKYIILARTLTDIDSPTLSLMKYWWVLQSSQLLCFLLWSHSSVRFDRIVRLTLVPPNDFIFVYNYNYYCLTNNDT